MYLAKLKKLNLIDCKAGELPSLCDETVTIQQLTDDDLALSVAIQIVSQVSTLEVADELKGPVNEWLSAIETHKSKI